MKKIGALALFLAAVLSGLPGLRPHITSPSIALGRVGEPFAYRITASRLPREFAASLPPASGLSAAPDSGWIVGTPIQAGTFTIDVSARNILGEAIQRVTLVVSPPSALDAAWSTGLHRAAIHP